MLTPTHGIFLPRANEEVTSPVALSAALPNGEQHFTITDLATRKTVFDEIDREPLDGDHRLPTRAPPWPLRLLEVVVRSVRIVHADGR